ncbi:TetR/AcrR family transcriptional regulator [Paenibacillus aquistagni]|uniref:Transcriptional regulator, TetR family n=1 Tax=Paenibacillus aquistagni TaxID=1852522 RepID=A0A1X7LUY8_9BACL|nr:TetR/AcrR family transcriptional regulator [Paenibacillus aquistagni]SMG57716.1 transcriptional regulator, TetR family [Paenibacillus aquistagni]
MYSGTNPSAIRSQKWLTEALLLLMEEKPYKSITVKELTERSDLARQTFYQLFDSKEEILEYHLDHLFQIFLHEMHKTMLTTSELVRLYFAFFEQHERFIRLLIQNDLISILNNKFNSYLGEIMSLLELEQDAELDRYAVAFLSSGLVGLLVYWFDDKKALTIDKLVVLVDKMFNNECRDKGGELC